MVPGIIVFIALLAYTLTLGNGLVFDDEEAVTNNRLITSLRNIPTLLTTGYWSGADQDLDRSLYRPLVTTSFALNYAVHGVKPIGYHAVSILLHAAVSLAVYALGRRLFQTREAAAVAAALFAVHPLHVEAVAGIVSRAELLMSLGVLLALIGYIRAGVVAPLWSRLRLGSLAAFAVGLLAKEQSIVLPALLVMFDIYAARQASCPLRWTALAKDVLPRLLPYAGILALYFLLRAWAVGGIVVPSPHWLDNPLAHVSLGTRLLTALAVAGRYLTLILWPFHLSPDYSYNQIPVAASLLDGRVLLAALLWGSLIALAAWSFTRGRGTAAFATTFTLITFLPAANLIVPIGTIMGERLFYLPSAGLCWLAGLGWQTVLARTESLRSRRVTWSVLGAFLLAFTVQTGRYSRIWRDDLTLFSYGVQAAPNSAKMQFNFGSQILFRFKDRREEAILHLRRAVELLPTSARWWDALGRAYLDVKDWDQAMATFRQAMEVDPTYPHPYNNIGLAYVAVGRWDDAMAAFRKAVALKPDLAQAHRNLADVYSQKGWTKAEMAERALELTPSDPLAWIQAGTTFLQLNWSDEALDAFVQAVRLDPKLPEAYLRLAQACERLDRFAEAAGSYEALLRLRPNAPAIHRHLAELYATRLADPTRAAAHLRQADAGAPSGQ